MKELVFQNGEPVDAVCHACQKPGANVRLSDGELYHDDCAPEGLL